MKYWIFYFMKKRKKLFIIITLIIIAVFTIYRFRTAIWSYTKEAPVEKTEIIENVNTDIEQASASPEASQEVVTEDKIEEIVEEEIIEAKETAEEESNSLSSEGIPKDSSESPRDLPAKADLNIPFQSQAPHANWDMPYQEGCEEASIILAIKYLQGATSITAAEMDAEILALVDWQNKNWGGHHDLTAKETAKLLKKYYAGEFETEIIEDFTWDDVQQAINQGYPVIAPTAGRELGNPYYTAPGPIYHMLVIKGYDANYVITNDVGTRRGADYKYTYDTLYNGIHDWNDGAVANGKKVIIVVKLSM